MRSSMLVVMVVLVCALASTGVADEATGRRGIVATVHPLATEAALAAFSAGGNAIDAAAAAGATLGVVDGFNSGLGGGCFILIHTAAGESLVLDGRETAPAAATAGMFVRDGKADTGASQTGPLAVGVPGALAAYAEAVRRFGRLPLSAALAPGARIAGDGFVIDAGYARKIAAKADDLRRFPASSELFFTSDGSPLAVGDRLVQPDLAASYARIAADGPEWFYRGPFAQAVGEWMAAHVMLWDYMPRYSMHIWLVAFWADTVAFIFGFGASVLLDRGYRAPRELTMWALREGKEEVPCQN
ncbi:MAG: gamma-glutamyltransferase [Pirellulales bacterium]